MLVISWNMYLYSVQEFLNTSLKQLYYYENITVLYLFYSHDLLFAKLVYLGNQFGSSLSLLSA